MPSLSNADLEALYWSKLFSGEIGAGLKGDPGGIVLGTVLTDSMNLNDQLTDGIYRRAGTTPPGGLNYPIISAGILYVNSMGSVGSYKVQLFYPGLTATDCRVHFSRTCNNGVWTPWRSFNSTRTDETAGRAIYQWDELNSREQLIYGDTGERDVSALLINGWSSPSGRVSLLRTDSTVYLSGSGVSNINKTSDIMLQIPAGFRPITQNAQPIQAAVLNGAPANYAYARWNGDITVNAVPSSAHIIGSAWVTKDPWPTTLPGVAVGTIPNT